MILLLTGCTSSLTPTSAVDDGFFKEFKTGYAGYASEFQSNDGKSVWQSSISLLLDGYVNSEIQNVDY